MKTLIAVLLLSSLSAPVLAMQGSAALITGEVVVDGLVPGADDVGRRSGNCPRRGTVAREGSVCGGV